LYLVPVFIIFTGSVAEPTRSLFGRNGHFLVGTGTLIAKFFISALGKNTYKIGYFRAVNGPAPSVAQPACLGGSG